jgi:hypothetical protein
MLLWHRKTIVLEGENVPLNCFADVRDGSLAAVALRNAAWKTRALGNPKAVLTGINEYLSHGRRVPARLESSTQRIVAGDGNAERRKAEFYSANAATPKVSM